MPERYSRPAVFASPYAGRSPVLAICDCDHARAEDVAREFGVPDVCESPADLIAGPGVDIVDIGAL